MNNNEHEIRRILDQLFLCEGPVTIADDGKVSVDGDCALGKNTTFLPITFARIGGDFECFGTGLMTLKGCPQIVDGSFLCFRNNLKSLEHAPVSVGMNFDCSQNRIASLEHCPKAVDGWFDCTDNRLTDLRFAPDSVGGDFMCSRNPISSLDGLPKSVGDILSLDYSENLPLLRLVAHRHILFTNDDGVSIVLADIIKKWCQANGSLRSRIVGCQNELIANGFENNARW